MICLYFNIKCEMERLCQLIPKIKDEAYKLCPQLNKALKEKGEKMSKIRTKKDINNPGTRVIKGKRPDRGSGDPTRNFHHTDHTIDGIDHDSKDVINTDASLREPELEVFDKDLEDDAIKFESRYNKKKKKREANDAGSN